LDKLCVIIISDQEIRLCFLFIKLGLFLLEIWSDGVLMDSSGSTTKPEIHVKLLDSCVKNRVLSECSEGRSLGEINVRNG